MKKNLYNKLFFKITSQRGAMDKILVTLLLVVVSLALFISLHNWSDSHRDNLINESDTQIQKVMDEVK